MPFLSALEVVTGGYDDALYKLTFLLYFTLLYFTSRGLQNREKQNIILIEEIMFLAATFL